MSNSLKHARILEKVGLSRVQAETHLKIISDVLGDEVAAKSDILNLDQRFTGLNQKVTGIDSKVSELDRKVNALDVKVSELDHKVDKIENRITLKLGGLMTFLLLTLPVFTKWMGIYLKLT